MSRRCGPRPKSLSSGRGDEKRRRGRRMVQTRTGGSAPHMNAAHAGGGAHATQKVTGKRLGEVAEAAFLAKASDLGFRVAKPWGDSDPYDFIVETGGRLWKVQVKSAHRPGEDGS